MALGYLADVNEVANAISGDNPCTITSNVPWLTTAPLEAMRTTPLVDAAVSAQLGTAAAPVWIQLSWAYPVDLTYAGLLDTNLWPSAGFRMEAWADHARTYLVATTLTPDGRDRKVVPPLTDPAKMRAGAGNQMRGDLDPRDLPLFPMNLHAPVPLCRARVIRWSLWGGAYRADRSQDTGYRISLAWAGAGLSIDRHVGGSGESVKSNDERIETPGGSVWIEPGITKRVATIDRAVTDAPLRDELFKMAVRMGKEKPAVWLPDQDDPAACFLYGGLFRRVDDHSHKFIAPQYVAGGIELEEWKE